MIFIKNALPLSKNARLSALDAHGNAHAAADAQRRQALLGSAALHFVQQRYQNARTGRTDRMADGNGAAIDVDLRRIPAEVLVHRAGLSRERFVGLDQIEIVMLPT